MIIILVNWLIKKGSEDQFITAWRKMSVGLKSGLYREMLTSVEQIPNDPKFNTFSITDPNYTTFINIGIWESLEAFDEAIGKYIPKTQTSEAEDGRKTITISLEEYEFKLRERVVLKKVFDRGGDLPSADLLE
jgi:heme-degrading monooxygenase HmoA